MPATGNKQVPSIDAMASKTVITTQITASTGGSSLGQEGGRTTGRGGLVEAIRDMRSGSGLRRKRTEIRQRPLSRVFLDGSR